MNFKGGGRFDRFLGTRPILGFLLIVGTYALIGIVLGTISGHLRIYLTSFIGVGLGNGAGLVWKARRNPRGVPPT